MAKFKQEHEEDESGAWLMSYADMMTLIACFFILLIAFASFDPVGFTIKTQEIANHFNRDRQKHSMTKLEILQEEISQHPELIEKLKVSLKDGELAVTFSGSALFEGESHLLSDEALIALDVMIDIIRAMDPNFRVLVEGHTDNLPLSNHSTFTSHWALSAARASSVVERFEFFGFDPTKIIPIGLGHTKPLVPNEDENGYPIEENLQFNRRVIIKVLQPINLENQIRMGLGVYFKDATE
jgi:chemotaxis protein MotB